MYMQNILGIKGIKVVKQGRHFSTRGNNVKIAKKNSQEQAGKGKIH